MNGRPAPECCAVCGADIPPQAKACPECGADERTGWREQSLYDGLDLPGDDPAGANPRPGAARFWKVTGLVLLGLVVVLVLLNRFWSAP